MSRSKEKVDTLPIHLTDAGNAGKKELGSDKMARNTARFDTNSPRLRKPPWIRVRLPAGNAVAELRGVENHLRPGSGSTSA